MDLPLFIEASFEDFPRMPRSRGGSNGRASSRPAAVSARPSVNLSQQPSRGASTVGRPPAIAQQAGPTSQQGKSPGLFGQMASTAA